MKTENQKQIDEFIESIKNYEESLKINIKQCKKVIEAKKTLDQDSFKQHFKYCDYTIEELEYFLKNLKKAQREMKKERKGE